MAKEEDVGVVGGVNVGLPILMTMSAFLSIALYNVIELNFHIFAVFKQRKGLYFWSLVIATWGIAPHAIGFIFKFFQVITLNVLSGAIVGVGWIGMVTGQSLVLYSRLHLVVQDERRIRWVLYMIIFNVIVMHCPVMALALGTEATQSESFLRIFVLYDKVQLVVFSVQETIISAIYIYQTVHLLGHNDQQGDSRGNKDNENPLRKLLMHLILVNMVVVALDITLVAVQFSGHYEIQTTYKTAVYSVKLKIEFSVLNRLARFVTQKRSVSGNFHLDTFNSSKRTRTSSFSGGHGSFIKMDDLGPLDENGLQPSKTKLEVIVENIETGVKTKHDLTSARRSVESAGQRPPARVD